MANVKLKDKDLLEKFQAEIVIKCGKKLSQQEVLDKSIKFAYNRFYEFIEENIEEPRLTKELVKRLKETASDAPLYHLDKSDDELLYGS